MIKQTVFLSLEPVNGKPTLTLWDNQTAHTVSAMATIDEHGMCVITTNGPIPDADCLFDD